MGRERRKSYECLNCGERLKDHMNYCPSCGQENHKMTVGLKLLISDFFKDYLTFDSKIFRSLKPLIMQPGALTKEYSSGKRALYIPPIRLYIFISFVFFFVSSLSIFNDDTSVDAVENEGVDGGFLKGIKTGMGSTNYEINIDSLAADSTQSLNTLQKALSRYDKMSASEQEEATAKGISYMMFIFLPVYALLLMLIFFRQKRYYVEHLVFGFHVHSFYFLIFLASIIFNYLFDTWLITLFFFLAMLFYTFKAIQNVYQPKLWKAIVQTSVVLGVQLVFIFIGLIGVFLSIVFRA